MENQPSHFKGKDALGHVAEAQAQGLISATEIHGTEVPGPISSGADAARDTALTLLLVGTLMFHIKTPHTMVWIGILGLAFIFWKAGRSAWLGWSRLERLHRVLAQEKWEIDHNRPQERAELAILYQAKGFQGQLLEDVLDVLMADGDRLLKVMVEEEMGLSLQNLDHPLKQAIGAAFGAFLAFMACLIGGFVGHEVGLILGAMAIIGCGAAISAHYSRNNLISAIIWNLGLGFFAYGIVYFLTELYLKM